MKKVKGLFLAALAATAMFTSCGKDEDAVGPEIKFVNYDGSAMTINKGDTVAFTFQATKGDAKIANEPTVVYALGTNTPAPAKTTVTELDEGFEVAVSQVINEVGSYTFYIDAVDKDGLADSATVMVTVKEVTPETTALGTATELVLYRPSSTTNPGLSSVVGIEYKSNLDASTAKFTATAGAQFVIITSANAANITTVEALTAAFSAGSAVTEFTSKSDSAFETMWLVSKVGESYILVEFKSLKFAAGDNQATFSYKM